MLNRTFVLILLLSLSNVAQGASNGTTDTRHLNNLANSERNPNWAQPIQLKGVPNFYKVSGEFYRSAQIDGSGIESLSKPPYSIKTIISLRGWHDDLKILPEGILTKYGIRYERIPMKWGGAHPEKEDVVKFLRLVATAPKPILVHCLHGADRTGFITAVYRIAVEDWSAAMAVDELKNGEYGANIYLAHISKHYLQYFRSKEFEDIRHEAGLPESKGRN